MEWGKSGAIKMRSKEEREEGVQRERTWRSKHDIFKTSSSA
jgi:hypothetical protein